MATSATEAHGSELFRIRRIVALHTDADAAMRAWTDAAPPLKIEAMAVHTHEKKQLLAMSIAEDTDAVALSHLPAPVTSASAASATAPSIALGHLPAIEPRKSRVPTGATATAAALSSRDAEKKKQAAAAAALSSASNYLLVRTIEEDERARFWKFPVYSTSKQQSSGKREKLVALEFSPEGDWIAGLSSRKNRLHLIPVLTLIARERKRLLDATYTPRHSRELMSVAPSVMTTQMASYLRATNEVGGLNGARYHSQVAGDDAQMSMLEFAVGIGTVTCCRWWRALNGVNYCLVGGTESLISIVNVEENAEECRCELQNAGTIVAIDLVRENFRKETRTSMLVHARGHDSVTRYYRVVLEKKIQQQSVLRSSKSVGAIVSEASTVATGSFASASGTPSFTTASASVRGPSPLPQYVVKTFPQHFLEDADFRPQRIKKHSPHVALYAINSLLTTESALALYDSELARASLFSNFQWSVRNEYAVPPLASIAQRQHSETPGDSSADAGDSDAVQDVEIAYCTTDLLLLQGTTATTRENVSAWLSLPSHTTRIDELDNDGDDQRLARAHIVHYLSLHDNEKIVRVVQSTSRTPLSASRQRRNGSSSSDSDAPGEAQVIYLLQTAHNVYECRPQWSRLALFKTLCAQAIALENARSIGYALGIDMASLCQVVAETLCAHVRERHALADSRTIEWIRDLFLVSRALPTTAIEQLTAIGGASYAIAFAQKILSDQQQQATEASSPLLPFAAESSIVVDAFERKQVAQKLVDLVLREQLRANVVASPSADEPTLRPRDVSVQQRLDATETWLLDFLATSRDYDTADIVDLCLAHQHIDKAVLVGVSRNEVALVLQKIIQAGLATFVSDKARATLLERGFARELAHPAHRLILRSFAIDTQVDVLLAHPPALLQQRDWVVRHLPEITRESLNQIAACLDPRSGSSRIDAAAPVEQETGALLRSTDVAASEYMATLPEERVELFLTVVLALNRDTSSSLSGPTSARSDDSASDAYAQAELEQLLKDLAQQYRPPVMVARCVDYGNWTAAASLYEAHGELVEAVEARLHSHKVLRPVSSDATSPLSSAPSSWSSATMSFAALRRRRQSSDASIESATGSVTSALSDESEFQDAMREELLELLQSLVVQRHSERAITAEMKAAILARLLVKWFEYGLAKTELEVVLIDPTVYPHVASLLAKIFFSDVVDGILGTSTTATHGHSDASSSGTRRGFDDRDHEWVRKCHHLPFSGQFLFHVCATFLESGDEAVGLVGDAPGVSSSSSSSQTPAPSPSLESPLPQQPNAAFERRTATQRLLDLVKDNVVHNDLARSAVTIEPHSAQALGKSDPLETHAKVFTCGHVFPKRVFDEEIVPEFEKRMATLPLPLLTTKQVLLREFRRSAVEAPCPICSFNKISGLVHQQQRQHLTRSRRESGNGVQSTTSTLRKPRSTSVAQHPQPPHVEFYFLHAQGKTQQSAHLAQQHRGNNIRVQSRAPHQPWRHEPWEWRASP